MTFRKLHNHTPNRDEMAQIGRLAHEFDRWRSVRDHRIGWR